MTSCRGFGTLLATAMLTGAMMLLPSSVAADCGGGDDAEYLARYAAQFAEVIVVGRLTAHDPSTGYSFDVVAEHKGQVSSPIPDVGVTDVGGCSQQSVEPGEEFVYVAGDRPGYPRLQLLFPHKADKGWVISHHSDYASLGTLLVLLGALPDTSTDGPMSKGQTASLPSMLILLAITAGSIACAANEADVT